MFIDTHAHIFMRDFDADREAVVDRARTAGVAAILNVGLDIETNQAVLDFARTHDAVFPIIGFHPHEASRFDAEAFENQVRANLDEIVALGEFGLDYAKEYSPRPAQRRAFERELLISNTVNKPVIIHCREAESDVLALLRATGPRHAGVMHCFSGDTDFLEQVLELGFYISVGGPVTYPKAVKLERVVAAVPHGRLLLETDCPYLAPQARRGKRNEPAYVPMIAARIAQIWKTTPRDVGDITTANALALFGITLPALERG